MGYFSTLAIEHITYDHDHSITPPEIQLLWRLEDLEDRLDELTARKTGRRDEGGCFSESDLRYVLPKDFFSVSNIRKAIELAINDLAERHGIYVRGKPADEMPDMDEISGMQMSFLDILPVQALYQQALAA